MRMKEAVTSLWGWTLSCALVFLCMGWRRRQQLTHSANTQIVGTSREKNSAVTFSFSPPPKGCRGCLNMKRDRSGFVCFERRFGVVPPFPTGELWFTTSISKHANCSPTELTLFFLFLHPCPLRFHPFSSHVLRTSYRSYFYLLI